MTKMSVISVTAFLTLFLTFSSSLILYKKMKKPKNTYEKKYIKLENQVLFFCFPDPM